MEMAQTGACVPNLETHHVCVVTPSPPGTRLHLRDTCEENSRLPSGLSNHRFLPQ
jgi:hypothetical protein